MNNEVILIIQIAVTLISLVIVVMEVISLTIGWDRHG